MRVVTACACPSLFLSLLEVVMVECVECCEVRVVDGEGVCSECRESVFPVYELADARGAGAVSAGHVLYEDRDGTVWRVVVDDLHGVRHCYRLDSWGWVWVAACETAEAFEAFVSGLEAL